ncbi:hypothetical protein NB688_000643 [Xanthomonas sacchari]|uniref:Uncharacterized protein n=1 Tax=Xanthomonas sacchari TaxID=56458 RepID=A0ABT3DTK0_9XANT|nr:hypothetical protein [Xanthomonas sacchari]MCW0418477.1 hypothetical protein [Xanthomonas sacchari]
MIGVPVMARQTHGRTAGSCDAAAPVGKFARVLNQRDGQWGAICLRQDASKRCLPTLAESDGKTGRPAYVIGRLVHGSGLSGNAPIRWGVRTDERFDLHADDTAFHGVFPHGACEPGERSAVLDLDQGNVHAVERCTRMRSIAEPSDRSAANADVPLAGLVVRYRRLPTIALPDSASAAVAR